MLIKMTDTKAAENQAPIVLIEQDGNQPTKPHSNEEIKVIDETNTTIYPVSLSQQNETGEAANEVLKKPSKDVANEAPKEGAKETIVTNLKKRGSAVERSEQNPLIVDKRSGVLAYVTPIKSPIPSTAEEETKSVHENEEEDVFIEKTVTKHMIEEEDKSEWSDDEEAGGLPRSDSRASRVSRAVRHLFCCGVKYEAASEENLPTERRPYNHAI